MIINPANLQFAFWSMNQLFQQVLEETPVQWPVVATETKSETEEEFYAWLKRIPELREWTGERRINNLSANVYRIKNKKFEDTFGVPREKFEDDKYGIYTNQAIRELAFATKIWPDQIVAAAMTAGGTALAHDGQAYFSANHPVNPDDPASAVQSNLFTASPLTPENVSLARAAGAKFKSENGISLELKFDVLIVPPTLETIAKQICEAEFLAPAALATSTDMAPRALGANTIFTQTNVLRGTLKYAVLPRLSADSDTTCYLACTNRAVKPFIFQNRLAPEFTWMNKPDDQNVFMLDQYLYGVRTRGSAGYGPYYLCIKNQA